MGPADIKRPRVKREFSTLASITSSYQFMVTAANGEMASRSRSCWCNACHTVVLNEPSADGFMSNLRVPRCKNKANTLYHYKNRSAQLMSASGVALRNKLVNESGKKLAQANGGLKVGTWCLFEARGDPVSPLWLGRTVSVPSWSGKCHRTTSKRKTMSRTRFSV